MALFRLSDDKGDLFIIYINGLVKAMPGSLSRIWRAESLLARMFSDSRRGSTLGSVLPDAFG
jgi:hypothetical protein